MKHIFYIAILSVIILIGGCSRKDKVDLIFNSVIEHYNNSDSLKILAAKFLHEHILLHYGVEQKLYDSLMNEISDINPHNFKNDTIFRHFLNQNKIQFKNTRIVYDADTITKEFLIKNIDMAFDSWRNNYWCSNVNFEDFCRYILPYRNANEELSNWREYFKDKYEQRIKDSLGSMPSIKEVVLFMMKELKNDVKYGTQLRNFYANYMTPEMSEKMYTMECIALAHYGTLALRACGVPCAMIETHWRFTETSHTSIYIPTVGSNDTAYRISIYDEIQRMGQPKDSMASWRTWMYSYEKNDDLIRVYENNHKIASLTHPVTRQDITNLFSTTHNIAISIPDSLQNEENLFLCRFSNWRWFPIREGFVCGDSVYFKNVTIKQLYRIAKITQTGICHVIGDVLSLDGNGDVVRYNCTGDTTLFKIAYNCDKTETVEKKEITSFYWSKNNKLVPLTKECQLWSFNEKTHDYKPYSSELAGEYKPVFYLFEAFMPCWTFFYDNNLPRPLGFIPSENSDGAFLIQF